MLYLKIQGKRLWTRQKKRQNSTKIYSMSKSSPSLSLRMTTYLIRRLLTFITSWIYTSYSSTLFVSGFIWLREKWQLQWWFTKTNSQWSSCCWKLCFTHQSFAECRIQFSHIICSLYWFCGCWNLGCNITVVVSCCVIGSNIILWPLQYEKNPHNNENATFFFFFLWKRW